MAPDRVEITLRRGLPSARDAWEQAHRLGLAVLASRPELVGVDITVNNNGHRVIAWRRSTPRAQLSVHWSLLPHIDGVLGVMAGEPGAWDELRRHLVTTRARRRPQVRAQGDVHDLDELLHEQRSLAGAEPVPVTWGRWPSVPPHHSLRLGSCSGGPEPLIRVHPVLDHASVPTWFVGFIVFHELLHVVHPPEEAGGRRNIHTPRFLRAEARHPDWGRAQRWEREHIGTLLRRTRIRVLGRG